jgi:hypothetical protein
MNIRAQTPATTKDSIPQPSCHATITELASLKFQELKLEMRMMPHPCRIHDHIAIRYKRYKDTATKKTKSEMRKWWTRVLVSCSALLQQINAHKGRKDIAMPVDLGREATREKASSLIRTKETRLCKPDMRFLKFCMFNDNRVWERMQKSVSCMNELNLVHPHHRLHGRRQWQLLIPSSPPLLFRRSRWSRMTLCIHSILRWRGRSFLAIRCPRILRRCRRRPVMRFVSRSSLQCRYAIPGPLQGRWRRL